MSWPNNNGIQSYDRSKFEKVGNFYVPTCPFFAGPVTIIQVDAIYFVAMGLL